MSIKEKLSKIRTEHPDFDKELVNMFSESMPKLLCILIDGKEYNNHIGSEKVAYFAEKYIKNSAGEFIGFKWACEDILSIAKNYINIDDEDFYPHDLFVWANVKYGDRCHKTKDPSTIISDAIDDLKDPDFPYFDPSQKAYHWVKKHVIQGEND